MRKFFLTILLVAGWTPTWAQGPTGSPSEIVATMCFVKVINEVDIPAQAEGTIELMVEEGDEIRKGDPIAVVDNRRAKLAVAMKQAEVAEATLNADNDVNIEDARNSNELASEEAESHKAMYLDAAISESIMKKKVLEAKRADLRVGLAEMQQDIARAQLKGKKSELKAARLELDRCTVKAPFAGFVEERTAAPNEWVTPGAKIIHLVQLDQLRVEGFIKADFSSVRVVPGTPVTVNIFPGGVDDFQLEATKRTNGALGSRNRERRTQRSEIQVKGKIGFVSTKFHESGTRFWVEIKNQRGQSGEWRLKPGMPATISID